MHWKVISTVAISLSLAACANIQTISRTTPLPTTTDKSGSGATGIAIHLDAQQRLVIVNSLGKYCSEPSPDALAAYASSLGLGIGATGYGSGSLASANQNAAASIGLRTQSITLMRDTLAQMCTSYVNGAIGPAQVAILLNRSQDLAAAILAIEQLTGAVSANQVSLTPQSSANASATILANAKLLEQAQNRLDRAEKTEDKAKEREAAAKQLRDEAVQNHEAAEATRNSLPPTINDDTPETDRQAIYKADAKLKETEQEKKLAQNAYELAAQNLERKEERVARAQEAVDKITDNQEAATTDSSATSGSSADFGRPVQVKNLSDGATKEIATAVKEIVITMLTKDYSVEGCMALITSPPQTGNPNAEAIKFCQDLVMANAAFSAAKAKESRERVTVVPFGADSTSDRIDTWLDADTNNRTALGNWIKGRDDPDLNKLDISDLLNGPYRAYREAAILGLNIP